MNKLIKLSLVAVSALVLTTGCVSHNENMEHHNSHNTHWGYTGDIGPSHWGNLNEKFAMCSNGMMQSPINIVPTKDINLEALGLNYDTKSTSVINNGHTVQVNIKEGSSVVIDGKEYQLKQFHFHTPSENNINSKSYPLEAHFVHASKDGKLAVVAVMFEEGESNPIIDKIWSQFPLELNKEKSFQLSASDVYAILPQNKDYYKFMGSLTTPPCTEGVKWNVFKTSVTISKDQVKKFFDIFGHTNNRPVQKTNNRVIYK
jgi:carbonic anhydrase